MHVVPGFWDQRCVTSKIKDIRWLPIDDHNHLQQAILTLLVDINDDQFPPEGYGCLIPTNTGGRKNPPRGPDSVTPTNKSHSGSNVNGQDMHNVI